MAVRHQATLEGYGTVWFSKDAITNILSLKNMTKIYRVSYDSDVASSFIVHRESTGKENMEFRMHPSGLHYHDPSETEESCSDISPDCRREQERFHEEASQGCRVCTDFVREASIPINRRISLGCAKPCHQGLSDNGPNGR